MRMVFLFILGLLAISLLAVGFVAAQGGYELDWWTAGGGGGLSSGGAYTLSGTIGQPAAGTMAGGDFTLAGGFWPGASGDVVTPAQTVYLPVILR